MKICCCQYENQQWQHPLPDWNSEQTLVLVFAARTLETDQGLWESLKTQYPNSIIAGCSSAGEIFEDLVYENTASVAIAQFEHTRLRHASTTLVAQNSLLAGKQIADQLARDDLVSVILLSDGISVNGSELVEALKANLPDKVIVTGGLAGDGVDFKRTWTLVNGQPQTNTITAIGFYGDRIRIHYGSQGGWHVFGPERLVTKADKNIVYEFDGQPALALYKEYLGDYAAALPASGLRFPLAILSPSDEEPIVRTLLAIDETTQALVFAGDVPTGASTQLMHASFDNLVEGAAEAAHLTQLDMQQTGPFLAVAISCVGRKLLLKTRIDEEVEATLDRLPRETHQIGFYSYGELSPTNDAVCRLHNQTMTLTLISEV